MPVDFNCKVCDKSVPGSKRANCICESCRKKKRKDYYLECKDSGKVAAYKEANKDRIAEYNVAYQRAHSNTLVKRARKLEMCAYKGNQCEHCAKKVTEISAAAFDFHHVVESDKLHDVADMVLMRWEKIVAEIDKCKLLCSNCHRILHANVQSSIPGWDDF